MTRIASCCCGACKIEADGEPLLNAICHCDNCKRRTGSAFGWSAYFPDGAVRASGDAARYHVATTNADRFFCRACGTTLYWRSDDFMAGHTGVAGGCFTDEPLGAPSVTATDSRRCAWLTLPTDWLAAP